MLDVKKVMLDIFKNVMLDVKKVNLDILKKVMLGF